jgi:D-proline reductase (dithiol) PrdB
LTDPERNPSDDLAGSRSGGETETWEVDSFKFLPRLIALFYQNTQVGDLGPIPWTPLVKPLEACRAGLVTSAGLYRADRDPPFDLERELSDPTWGDPSYRSIPIKAGFSYLQISHLHLNTDEIIEDTNIVLPIEHFQELAFDGEIADLTEHAFSFMGFQGFPPNWEPWRKTYGPKVAQQLLEEGADFALLTPA